MQLHLDQPLAHWLPLPSDLPFTRREALAHGLTDRDLRRLVEQGLLRRPLRGVFVDARLPDTLDLRVATLTKVMPEGCFVADRTAGWLHGANMILAPNDHLTLPKVSLFHLPGNRCRRDLASSGERDVTAHDLVEVGGLQATSPLRTALDLGRLLPRAQALAALDSLLGLGVFTDNQLLGEVERFAKQRGVRQLRFLAPLADALAASPGESGLRLLWYDGGLPKPRLQIPYVEDGREVFHLDMGLEEIRFAAEYDGEEWHSASDAAHDRRRRTRMREQAGWQIEEFRREDVFGHRKDADWALRSAVAQARRSFDRRTRHL
ncbi:MAG TPA: type IV toxin-antitoxin system AbiEi family antitoxin domain-containing protein [Nocardioides sp.]